MIAPFELRLASDDLEVVLLPDLGGRLHRVRAFGKDLLRTPDDPGAHRDSPFFWGAYPMAPWCNRASPGRRVLAGREVDLAPNFPDGSAIHGLVSSRAWRVDGPGALSVRGGDGTDGWPWPFEVRLDAAVDGAVLRLAYRLANRSDAPMPAGVGLHPWFRRPVEVGLGAAEVYPANTDSAARPEPVAGRFDLRTRGQPAPGMDGTWTALAEPRVRLAWPELGVEATLDIAANHGAPHVALATPADIGAVALEPQTHGPDPLRRLERGERDAPVVLPPGGELTLDLGLRVALARSVR